MLTPENERALIALAVELIDAQTWRLHLQRAAPSLPLAAAERIIDACQCADRAAAHTRFQVALAVVVETRAAHGAHRR
jgi:hypothetical protein